MDTIAFTTSTSNLPYNSVSVSVPVSIPVRVRTTTSCSFSSSTSFNNSSKLLFASQTVRNSSVLKRRSSRISCGLIQEITETQFSDVVLKSDRPVLVEFVATWCGPCRLIAPAVQSIAEEYKEKLTVVKLDHDANPKLIEEYKIYGLPALIVFKDGKEVPGSRREGAITKVKLKEYVDAQLQSVSVA